MGKWNDIYQALTAGGMDIDGQLAGTTWLDRFVPQLIERRGRMLDLGCGLGADLLRCAQLGFEPTGFDLEPEAVDFVTSNYGFHAVLHDMNDPLPFEDSTFSLVLSRFALHYLSPKEAAGLLTEIRRITQPGGHFLFAVNGETHFRRRLQYEYADVREIAPGYWHFPEDRARTILFYTPELARELMGPGWRWRHLGEEPCMHWNNIMKWAVVGLAQRLEMS